MDVIGIVVNKYIDLRILRSDNAAGIMNACIGLYHRNQEIMYIHNYEHIKTLDKYKIPKSNRLEIKTWRSYTSICFTEVILPLQRPSIDVFLLSLLGVVELSSFVHDLHFLIDKPLLRKEFQIDKLSYLKKVIYLLTMKYVKHVYVDSLLVKRQLASVFNIDAERVNLLRVFDSEDYQIIESQAKKYDYFIPSSQRLYKSLWALERIYFESPNPIVVVPKGYSHKVSAGLIKNNPNIKVYEKDTTSDANLIECYRESRYTLTLSRYEGFGFTPYEAGYFNSIPIVLNCSSYIEIPGNVFLKINLSPKIFIPSSLPKNISYSKLCKEHVKLI